MLFQRGYGSQNHDDSRLPQGATHCITFSERSTSMVPANPHRLAQQREARGAEEHRMEIARDAAERARQDAEDEMVGLLVRRGEPPTLDEVLDAAAFVERPALDPAEAHYREGLPSAAEGPSAPDPNVAAVWVPDEPEALWRALQAAVTAKRCRLVFTSPIEGVGGVLNIEQAVRLELPRERVVTDWEPVA